MVLSASKAEGLRKMVDTEGLEYTFLHDPDAEVIELYGLRNPEHPASHGIVPHPTALVIDREGKIRYKRVETDYRIRPSAEELLEAVRGLTTPR